MTGQWYALSVGHTRILEEIDIVGSSDYMTSRCEFSINFSTSIPKREDWKKRTAQHKFTLHDSKLEGAGQIGIYAKSIGMSKSMRLPAHCSVFQAEGNY